MKFIIKSGNNWQKCKIFHVHNDASYDNNDMIMASLASAGQTGLLAEEQSRYRTGAERGGGV